MSIKKYIAEKDSTITDAFKENLIVRGTNSNMGAADSLEMFSIYGQANSSSLERSRILVQFPVNEILSDRNNSKVPASGSVNFFLRMFNVEHPFSVPRDFTASISVVSQSWDEGYGLDMDNYSDLGWASGSVKGSGCTWLYATSGATWNNEGGDVLTGSRYNLTYSFQTGLEDVELNITPIVEDWLSGIVPNHGFLIKLSGSFEDASQSRSFYTKKFSARGSEYFYRKPAIEARWASIINDDRNNFFASSSAVSDTDNKMNIYFYNRVRGTLKNIVGNVTPGVKFYADSGFTQEISSSFKVISNPTVGVYKAQVAIDTTASVVYDRWYNTSSLANYFSSSITIEKESGYDYAGPDEYIINITNLKPKYLTNETARFKIYSRVKDWSPTIYTVAYNVVENTVLNNLYFKTFRLNDNYTIVDYSTGSIAFSKTSYDKDGNYFDLDMSLLEKDYGYGIKFALYENNELRELAPVFKFRVE
jgi:hypothetical protein